MKLRTLTAAVAALLAAGCADSTTPTGTTATPDDASRSHLHQGWVEVQCALTAPYQLTVGWSTSCHAVANDGLHYYLPMEPGQWSSSNSSIISVDNGTITAHQPGSAWTSVTVDGMTGSVRVEAYGQAQAPVLTSVSVSPTSATLAPSGSTTLSATAYDQYGTAMSATFSWSTSNASVATVSSSGMVTGVAAGTATITATSGGKSDTATVTVQTSTDPVIEPCGQRFCFLEG